MIGPKHYKEAQYLLRNSAGPHSTPEDEANALAAAQVHATLALAAATVLAGRMDPATCQAWDAAMGVKR